jgi:hypothetical protein
MLAVLGVLGVLVLLAVLEVLAVLCAVITVPVMFAVSNELEWFTFISISSFGLCSGSS